MPETPIRGEAHRLLSIQHIPNDIGREEGKVDHLLDATFGGAFRFCDLCKGRAGLDRMARAWQHSQSLTEIETVRGTVQIVP
ncbi:hypothetical protein N8I71_08995 [Roseibacterium sp. SDUM158016]|uniref:hypothetical protein n=1 Tax=Roseicyclus sediminis TaxID=2980997 RepID=UPI0021CFC603|nr:hypothetical protein [Roseibacterium sp. SDUM158016]MCU4652966.1 hypothetical protein [Roseibacterium sp. SDUM158016]